MSGEAKNLVADVRSASFYFWELVQGALQREKIKTDDLVEWYLATLLERFLRQDMPEATLFSELPRLENEITTQENVPLRYVRCLGDASLFVTGIFAPHLTRSFLGIKHYIKVGENAYRFLRSRVGADDQFSLVYQTFARDLRPFVAVFNVISREDISLTGVDTLMIREACLATGSKSAREWLMRRGIALLEGPDPKRIIV